ncbi:MAG: AAA family ATPase [Fibrobacterota bacterium]|nr:AAA family ATPase [Fibrobacterota bacterium]QQS05822.1 MAG: AAA family ATPase [Fibrobacterota bacterium]
MAGTSKFEHGLVVGKFYPPHRGHVHLVESALAGCHRVTVQVLYSSVESLPGVSRAKWLADCFPATAGLRVLAGLDDVPIDYESSAIWDAHEKIMVDLLCAADATHPWPRVDAVFSSESYGQEMARRFAATAVGVDPKRSIHPVSGTAVRSDLFAHWRSLPAPVRAGLCRRVVVVGAESTGTTTLSVDLHRALVERGGPWANTRWVAEYGREYSADLQARQRAQKLSHLPSDFPWNELDFREICRVQLALEEEAAREGSPVLVCDTDGLATCLWQERYMGSISPWVRDFAAALSPRALYLLTSHEGVAFEDDGLRDQPHLRPGMTQRFREVLAAGNVPWFELSGSPVQRLQRALDILDQDIESAFRFADPLG